jgi:hyperosmotically inducible periplasmic protein
MCRGVCCLSGIPRIGKQKFMKKTTISMGRVLKLSALILSVGALAMAGGLTGCAGDRYTQSTGERIDDKGDSSRVRERLSQDTQYKYDDVKVQTFKGVVQLSGFVNSRDQKNRAGDLARKVEGVKEVENNITVKETAK